MGFYPLTWTTVWNANTFSNTVFNFLNTISVKYVPGLLIVYTTTLVLVWICAKQVASHDLSHWLHISVTHTYMSRPNILFKTKWNSHVFWIVKEKYWNEPYVSRGKLPHGLLSIGCAVDGLKKKADIFAERIERKRMFVVWCWCMLSNMHYDIYIPHIYITLR